VNGGDITHVNPLQKNLYVISDRTVYVGARVSI
jgi:hypothetical protein